LEGSTASTPRDSFKENISDVKNTTAGLEKEVRTSFENKEPDNSPSKPASSSNRTLYLLGIIIIGTGLFFLLVNIFDIWRYAWPVLLIIAGAIVIVLVTRQKK
jgi:hypothetical protein